MLLIQTDSVTRAKTFSNPIFLLGTGRCGSTFQQQALSRVKDIWIWGEHDGIVHGFLNWLESAKTNKALSQFSYQHEMKKALSMAYSEQTGDATHLAWMNGFRPGNLDTLACSFLIDLFTCNLPEGKVRWGFKEIRYGPHDKTAESLLHLFPEGKILHTVRHPAATVESNLRSWNLDLLQKAEDGSSVDLIKKEYFDYVDRWVVRTRYFLELEQRMPSNVLTTKTECFVASAPEIADFLGVASNEVSSSASQEPVNTGPKKALLSDRVKCILKELRQEASPRFAELANQLEYTIE